MNVGSANALCHGSGDCACANVSISVWLASATEIWTRARKCRDDVSLVLIIRKNHNARAALPVCSNEWLGGDGEPVYAEPA